MIDHYEGGDADRQAAQEAEDRRQDMAIADLQEDLQAAMVFLSRSMDSWRRAFPDTKRPKDAPPSLLIDDAVRAVSRVQGAVETKARRRRGGSDQ